MKTTHQLLSLFTLGFALAANAANQNLVLPNVSTGADGALNAAVSQIIQLPPDGRLNYTTINIQAGASVTFLRNAANTPVYLLAQGDVTIDGNIDVSGAAGDALHGGVPGPGGFAGGMPGVNGGIPGDGLGPGAGLAGSADGTIPGGGGAYGTRGGAGCASVPSRNGQTYGSQLLLPLVGGSGGGGGQELGGGGGGGAILVASSTKIILSGWINAFGGYAGVGTQVGGSGGAVRLLAPTIEGSGTIYVDGDYGVGGICEYRSGAGRIRCDMVERSGFNITRTPNIIPTLANPPTPALLGNIAPFTIDQYLPLVLPPNLPSLRILSIGGIAVPANADAGYTVTLPLNAAELQPVIVEAANFGVQVPIAIKRTLPSGPSQPATEATIDNSAVNPATLTLSLPFPANTPVTVNVWTR